MRSGLFAIRPIRCLLKSERTDSFINMTTVTKQEVLEAFDRFGTLACAGETIMVMDAGKPWVKIVGAEKAKTGKSAAAFKARLNGISKKPIPGAAEILAELRR